MGYAGSVNPPTHGTNVPDLSHFRMPFTANRQFKADPRLLVAAKGMHYTTIDGRQVLDGTAGIWCVNAGHGRSEITEAVARQLDTLDDSPASRTAWAGGIATWRAPNWPRRA
jgi:beta-alanine--pyruvate transaminase